MAAWLRYSDEGGAETALKGGSGVKQILIMAAMALLVTTTILAGCERQTMPRVDDMTPGATVEMRGEQFLPSTSPISAGETVTWVNQDPVIHNVVGEGFSSGNIGEGETFSHTFDEPGVYEYTCTLHPGMDGAVVVE